MRRFFIVFISVVILSLTANAQNSSAFARLSRVRSSRVINNGIEFRTREATVRITALDQDVLRLRYTRQPNFPTDFSFAVVSDTGFVAPAVTPFNNASEIGFSTAKLKVKVERSGARVVITDVDGHVILEDQPQRPVEWNGTEFRVYKTMPKDEHYFGLGDKSTPLDRRDNAYTMWTTDAYGWQEGSDPLYKSIPFFIGLRQGRAYGVFLDNTYRSTFDLGKQSRDYYSFGADAGELNYYFLYGPDPKRVISAYTALTGRTPLPPLYTLGYQQSRYSYYPQARLEEVASELRKRRIPTDVLYLDIDYLDGYRAYDINRKYFPQFEKMVSDLGKQGFKLVVITDLHLAHKPGYAPYDSGRAGDHFVKNPDGTEYVGKVWPGESVFPDFTRAATRDWYGGLNKMFIDMGVRGFWNDMNEPAVFTMPDKTMPLDTVHRIEEGDYRRVTDHREIHNVVGMQNVRATYEGLLKLQPNQRPFVLTRAAFAGTQRYAATWTGDNQATWLHYRLSLPTLLGLGVSGYPLAGNDVGGFEGSPSADLTTRWMELGAFMPIFRNHSGSGTRDKEPWVHGETHEAIRRRYIETRYQLLPYIYTSMEETSRTGVPLMRPMFVDYAADEKVALSDKTFLFGNDLLVAPKLDEKLDAYKVTLPAGTWFNYWTGERVQGGKELSLDPPLDVLPVYARAGAIIPRQAVVQNTDEKPQGSLELRVYPGPNCKGSVYTDDGNTFDYKKGQYFRQQFTCEASASGIRVALAKPEGQYKPWWPGFDLIIANSGQWTGTPKIQVTSEGATVPATSFQRANGDVVVHMEVTAQPAKVDVSF